jgi:hypothetical protein
MATKNKDGYVTETPVNEDGSVTETPVNEDGSVTETPVISQSAMEFASAPTNAIKVAANIDRTIAANLARVVGASGTVTNSRTYASADDAQFKLDVAYMRKHLQATIDKTTQRVKVTQFAQADAPDTVSFYLSVVARNPRTNGEAENAPTEGASE